MAESASDSRSGVVQFFVIIDLLSSTFLSRCSVFITKFSLDVNVHISFY